MIPEAIVRFLLRHLTENDYKTQNAGILYLFIGVAMHNMHDILGMISGNNNLRKLLNSGGGNALIEKVMYAFDRNTKKIICEIMGSQREWFACIC